MTKKQLFLQIASFACVLHCIVAPLIVIVLPFLGTFFENIVIEIGIFLLSFLCGMAIIYTGYCKHKRRHVGFLFGLGIMFWVFHLLSEFVNFIDVELTFLVVGSLLVVFSYYFNHKHLKCCSACD
ncbi:hypothetical protein DID76_03135 [Candidatus Marinamargulisbacteria bacterium SCGC AG-414-C22]|nr:hypothetical protein DID76_03135 [Candidatus Marinamargulisbacteria bacterium SCGC AG-414-C22]